MKFYGRKIIRIHLGFFLLCLLLSGFGLRSAGAEGQKAEVAALPLDMVLVLDNSGSMKKNDPQFLLSRAADEFLQDLRPEDRLGVVIFAGRAVLTSPLAAAKALQTAGVRQQIAASLDYKGQYTNIPAALERALFELKERGRPEARKSIILLTDGKIDTGNPTVDIDRGRWVREELAADATQNGIGIFGIAFTENADFMLLQTLAHKTAAAYYRTLRAEDLAADLERLRKFLKKPAVAASSEAPVPAVAEPPSAPASPSPSSAAVPVSFFSVWVVLVPGLVVLILLLLLIYRGKNGKSEAGVPEITLKYIGIDPKNFAKHKTAAGGQLSGEPFASGESFRFRKSTILIGRRMEQRNQPNDLAIPGDIISKQHAKLVCRERELFLLDRESTNGTFLNGVRLGAAEPGLSVKHGAVISIFMFDFKVEIEGFSGGDVEIGDGPEKTDGTILVEEAPELPPEPAGSGAGFSHPPVAAASDQTASGLSAEPESVPAPEPVATPELVSAPAPEPEHAGTEIQTESRCSIHGSREAERYCAQCGRLFCNECLENRNGSYLCVDCRDAD